jgi:protein TonB
MTTMSRTRWSAFVMGMVVLSLAAAQTDPVVEFVPHDDSERTPLYTVVPAYPEEARRARVEGEVQVCFKVGRDGRTSRVAVRRSTNRVFEKPARDAVRLSTYKPLADDQKLSGIKSCRTFRFFLSPVAIEEIE